MGSNKGAYVKLVGPQLAPHFVQFTTATPRTKKLTFRQRVGLIESSAIRELSGQILSRREKLLEEFLKHDPEQTGETQFFKDFCANKQLETNSSSASQKILRVLENLKDHYSIHTSLPPVPILRQINPVHASSSVSILSYHLCLGRRVIFFPHMSPPRRYTHYSTRGI